jgi:acetoin utilization deacetylase AcuC-like enzyme
MPAHDADPTNGVALFYHPAFLSHDTGNHPESARRLSGILAELERRGIPESSMARPEPASLDLLGQVHDLTYVRAVDEVARSGGGYWDLDTHISEGSYDAALLAAGAAAAAVDAAMAGTPSFALVRPPGHHALHNAAMGFCLFNNAAVAAQHAASAHGLSRVMVVDWDVHHGNGTQDTFYDRSDVLFFSSHRYPFYPGTGALEETGEGVGRGYTVNVPLPGGVGDEGYVQVFEQVVVPLARRYRPELIVVSAGYDSHLADPLGGMAVTVAGFSEMARMVIGLAREIPECNGRLAAVLEGGYNVAALAASVAATIAAFGGRESLTAPDESGGTPTGWTHPSAPDYIHHRRPPDVSGVIERVRGLHGL